MPTYEYKCDACGHAFEKFQSITAPSIKKCPECGKSKVRRLISAGAGLIFKGAGFYITDYRSDGYKDSAKADNNGAEPTRTESTGDSKSAETKADSKSESKPAAKGDPKSDSKPAAAPKPESRPESKPESKPQSKPEPKPQASKSARKS